jgi:hypothetical protein
MEHKDQSYPLKVFESRLLLLVNSLPKERANELMKSLMGEARHPFRLYPSLLFISREKEGEKKCFKYSLTRDRYVPCPLKITEPHADLIPLGPDKYLLLLGNGSLFLIEGTKRKLVRENVGNVALLTNGSFLVNFMRTSDGDKTLLLNSAFETLATLDGDLNHLCSNGRYLVLNNWKTSLAAAGHVVGGASDTSFMIFDTQNNSMKTIDLNRRITSATLFGDHLVCTMDTLLSVARLVLLDIREFPTEGDIRVSGTGKTLMDVRGSLFVFKISENLLLIHEAVKGSSLWRFSPDGAWHSRDNSLAKIQEIQGNSPQPICDGLFIFKDTLEVWRVGESEDRACLIEQFTGKHTIECLYPTREEVRDVSRMLEKEGVLVPIDVCDLITTFCLEKI